MTEKEFFNGLINAKSDVLQKLLDIITENNINYCIIGGLAVNAYVDPVISLDLDIVIAVEVIEKLKEKCSEVFEIADFPHSINLQSPDSDIRIQIKKDMRYQDFIDTAKICKVLGYNMSVANIENVLQGKIWAYLDTDRRKSKRQKDLADIFRIIEAYPELEKLVPDDVK